MTQKELHRNRYRKLHNIPLDAPLHESMRGRKKPREKPPKVPGTIYMTRDAWYAVDRMRDIGQSRGDLISTSLKLDQTK